jgi:hypothetical protein
LQGVKDHLLSEACKAELRWDIPVKDFSWKNLSGKVFFLLFDSKK